MEARHNGAGQPPCRSCWKLSRHSPIVAAGRMPSTSNGVAPTAILIAGLLVSGQFPHPASYSPHLGGHLPTALNRLDRP